MQIERALQAEVMLRIQHAPVDALVIPIPNGVWLPARTEQEKSLVARLIARMKADGQLVPGAADLLVLARDFAGAIELKRPAGKTLLGKTPRGRASVAQLTFQARCAAAGVPYAICTSWAEVRDTLIAWRRLPASYVDPEQRIGRAA